MLSLRGGLLNAQLARRFFVTAQAMNQVLTSLETKGLMTRPEPGTQSRAHHRAYGTQLTPRGGSSLVPSGSMDEIEEHRFSE